MSIDVNSNEQLFWGLSLWRVSLVLQKLAWRCHTLKFKKEVYMQIRNIVFKELHLVVFFFLLYVCVFKFTMLCILKMFYFLCKLKDKIWEILKSNYSRSLTLAASYSFFLPDSIAIAFSYQTSYIFCAVLGFSRFAIYF